jgi:hypothetical protein
MSKKGTGQKVITTDSFPSAGGIADKRKKSKKKSKK